MVSPACIWNPTEYKNYSVLQRTILEFLYVVIEGTSSAIRKIYLEAESNRKPTF